MSLIFNFVQEINIPRNEIKAEPKAEVTGQNLGSSFVFFLVLVSVKVQNL